MLRRKKRTFSADPKYELVDFLDESQDKQGTIIDGIEAFLFYTAIDVALAELSIVEMVKLDIALGTMKIGR